MAFDKDTGKELWRALSAQEPGYAPPAIYEFAGKPQLILWHPEAVNGLDPETGKVCWTHRHASPVRADMTIPTPRKVGDLLFLTSFYNGSILRRVDSDQPSVVWQSKKVSEKDTDGLHSVMATPLIEDGHIYSPCYGQFRCLKSNWKPDCSKRKSGVPWRQSDSGRPLHRPAANRSAGAMRSS